MNFLAKLSTKKALAAKPKMNLLNMMAYRTFYYPQN